MTATASINFAPMLAVLFIGARMRALNMDPINGNPQKWAQNCFFMCTYALLAQTLCSVAVPLVLQGSAKVGKCEGDMEYEVENKMLGTVLALGRYVMMICIYVGVGCVIYSIFTIQHPKGPEYTIPISPTMQCVVMFCPMLAILFVGTRMYALQITDNKGAPQGWVQDGMYMATWSLLIQFVMVLVTPCATGAPGEVDEDGNIKWEPANPILFYAVLAIRWLGFLLLYGGIITVITGLYTMTPETANGRGAVPLVGDGKVPGAGVSVPGYEGIKEPYGVNDVPGTPIEQKF